MTIGDREGLIARIRQIRRPMAPAQRPVVKPDAPHPDLLRTLELRVTHLEQLLEGLQDSVHRESERHAKLIADLHARIQPGPMGAALAEEARHRGL